MSFALPFTRLRRPFISRRTVKDSRASAAFLAILVAIIQEDRLAFRTGRALSVFLPIFCLWACGLAWGQIDPGSSGQEWHAYAHDPGGMRFSPLKQIDPTNRAR